MLAPPQFRRGLPRRWARPYATNGSATGPMLITAAHKTQTPSSTGKKVGAVFALVGTEGVDLGLYLVVIDGLPYFFPRRERETEACHRLASISRCPAKKRAPLRRGSTHIYSGLGDPGSPTSGSSGIVGGSGAVPGSCSGIVPGSAGIGSSGVGRSGVVSGSWLAISSLPSAREDPSTRPATRKTWA
jgi:hypothetical protein